MNGISTLLGLVCGIGCIVKLYDAATMGTELLQSNMTWAGWLGGGAIFFFIVANASGGNKTTATSDDDLDRAVDQIMYPWEGMSAKDIIAQYCKTDLLGAEPWHNDKASKKQKDTLKAHEVSWHRNITKGEASLVITFIYEYEPYDDDD